MGKRKRIVAYSLDGRRICELLEFEAMPGYKELVPLDGKMAKLHRVMGQFYEGEEKVVFKGYTGTLLEKWMKNYMPHAFYYLKFIYHPYLGGKRKDRIRILQKLGLIKKPKYSVKWKK